MAEATTHIFRISLRPNVYRDIEIDSGASLYDLAATIVRAFDFDLDHAFGFYSRLTGNIYESDPKYELFADTGEETDALGVEGTTVAEVFRRPRKTMLFLFDYGDEWRFRVTFTRRGHVAENIRYPRLLGKVGAAPPQYPDIDEEDE
ncbi:MAG TPA: hypothetical protein VFG47_15420 [Geminicoccaceae bacterium]|nr:hypothetical protein [Geminicoccaceae bacterium]